MQPDIASELMAAIIDRRNARNTRTGQSLTTRHTVHALLGLMNRFAGHDPRRSAAQPGAIALDAAHYVG
jgi:hypothetical protein